VSLFDRVISLALPAVPKPLVRHFSRRYIAGPTIDDAMNTVCELSRAGAMSTLDILGEFIRTRDDAMTNTRDYEELFDRIARQGLAETHVSVKLTAMGLSIDREMCLLNMRRLCGKAVETENFVRIDMEDSECTDATLEIYETLRDEFPERVGAVLQSRLRRTIADVERLTEKPANIRLCKGIYVEPRRIAYANAELIRRNFALALHRMLVRGAYVGIATHDELLVWEALRLVEKHGLSREQYEFQMLLGVDEQLRDILLRAGHRVRVYVPYGRQWYQYSVRRLRENPQIAGYAFRAIFQRTPTP